MDDIEQKGPQPVVLEERLRQETRSRFSSFLDNALAESDVIAFSETGGAHGLHGLVFNLIGEQLDKFAGVLIEIPVDYQPDIDHFIKTGVVDQELEEYFIGAKREGNDIRAADLALFEAARREQKPVVCFDLDSSAYRDIDDGVRHGKRDSYMFEKTVDYVSTGGKWCLVSADGHLRERISPISHKKSLGTRLREQYKDNFYSISLRAMRSKLDRLLLVDELVCFDIRKHPVSSRLKLLMSRQKDRRVYKDNSHGFDGYIFHK